MSLTHSPRIVTDCLVFCVDAGNRKSNILAAKTNILDSQWAIGSGSYSNFSQNGSTDENERILAIDPWGNQSVVWETRANGSAADDGGWNSVEFAIDRTKLYRFSVWVKRTSSTAGGTFYFGTGAGGQEVMGVADGIEKGNPYWDCRGTSALAQNQWCLVCGHIYPYNTNIATNHVDTGLFTIADGKIGGANFCNIGTDLKWAPGSTSSRHRTYHYYCADNTTRLHFFNPRVDVCDGTEPSVTDMLNNSTSNWKDLSGNGYNGTLSGSARLPVLNGPSFQFDYTLGNLFATPNQTLNLGSGVSMEMFFKSSDIQSRAQGFMSFSPSPQYINFYAPGNGSLRWETWQNAGSLGGAFTSPTNLVNNTWYHAVGTYSSSGSAILYINGVSVNSAAYAATSYGSLTSTIRIGEYAGYLSGSISSAKIYNRALSAAEVMQNFNAQRGRFEI